MNEHKQLLAHWWPPLMVALLSVVAQGLDWVEAWRYERTLLGSEPWRLVSGHLVHLGWNHLVLNLTALLVLWALFGGAMRAWAWGVTFIGCALVISGGLYLRDSTLVWYVGLSGVLHGLLVVGALANLPNDRYRSLLLLALVVAKLAWEQSSGSDSGTAELVGGAVIINAHLYGALGGLACAPLARLKRQAQSV